MLGVVFNGMAGGKQSSLFFNLLPRDGASGVFCQKLPKTGQVPPKPVTFVLCPHSVILWLGDLNYRIEELDVEKVKKLIEDKAFQTLYAYDQVPVATCALFRLRLH